VKPVYGCSRIKWKQGYYTANSLIKSKYYIDKNCKIAKKNDQIAIIPRSMNNERREAIKRRTNIE